MINFELPEMSLEGRSHGTAEPLEWKPVTGRSTGGRPSRRVLLTEGAEVIRW
jgi:hypothetical protein